MALSEKQVTAQADHDRSSDAQRRSAKTPGDIRAISHGPRRVARLGLWRLLAVAGPGLVVMLADTDVGSIITAGQSGAQWGYRLIWLQVILIPILYVCQELTVRLGIFTGKGHGELIREAFGQRWAWLSVSGLLIACIGALITEFAGVVGVGQMFGVSPIISLGLASAALLAIVLTGSYVRVERVAILLGAFELAFVAVACYSHPNAHILATQLGEFPINRSPYLYLIAANLGAVIMPWMVFYQQSAVVDKGLQQRDYKAARWDTAVGAVITQVIMAAVLVAVAAVASKDHGLGALNTVGEISNALTPVLGESFGRIAFALGVLGAAMVSAIVVSLAAAWGLGEVTGYRRSLSAHPKRAPWFYVVYTIAVIAGAVIVGLVKNLVTLSIAVEVMNAFLLPLVLGFLVALALWALPRPVRLRGTYAWVVILIVCVTSVLGVLGAILGIIGFGG